MSGERGPKQGAVFGSTGNAFIHYKLDASQAGVVLCPLQSGARVFAAALFILQRFLHGANACCSHYKAVPVFSSSVAAWSLMVSVTAGQGLLGYFTSVCNA